MADQMTSPDPALAARLADLEGAWAGNTSPSAMPWSNLTRALHNAYRSGQIITLADHTAAVQAAVAKAVEAEREAIAAMLDRRAAQFPDDSEGDNHNTNAAYMVRMRSEPAIRARKGDEL